MDELTLGLIGAGAVVVGGVVVVQRVAEREGAPQDAAPDARRGGGFARASGDG